jgi:o-succinylbenzoate---CoA ligase
VSRYLGASPGVLVAVDLPPGPAWLDVLWDLWIEGVSFLPLDRRLSDRERRAVLELARPASIISEGDEVLFADPAPIEPEEAAIVVATSGTAGAPKLVELSRAAASAAVGLSFEALGRTLGQVALDPSEPWVACLTPAHVGGLLVLLRRLIFASPVTVLEGFDAATLLEQAPAGAHVALVPAMLRRLVEIDANLSALGVLLLGGSAVDPELSANAARRGGHVVATYGLTETCGGIAYDGRLFESTQARVAGGQIELHGPTLMGGYRHDPAATAAAFTLDGWLRTGDAGAIGDDGLLMVHGRLDDAIRTGSETVWPNEVERALRDHPKVADVAVAGRPDPEWGERVVAFVVPAHVADPPMLEELRAYTSERIARFKAPKDLVLLSELPRAASGKLRRNALPD